MKKILLLAFVIVIASCTKETPIDYAIISGTVTNVSSNKLTLYSKYNFGFKKDISINENGYFTDTVKIKSNNSFMLTQDRNAVNLFLNKGDNFIINFDIKKLDSTLTITGKGNEINNYLFEKSKIKATTKELFSKPENEFLAEINAVKKQKEDALFNVDGLPKSFKNNETKNINYEHFLFLNNYKNYHSYFTKNKDFDTSEGFLDALKDIDYNNQKDFIFSSSYRNLLSSHYRNESQKLVEKDSLANDISYLKALASIDNDIIKNKLLYDDAQYGITYTENLEDYYTLFSEASTNKKNNEKITKIYNELKVLTKGNPSPIFTNYENNAGGSTSLEDLKGKFVYIDVWATWCGPCIAEIPSLKKVEKEYHNKNIEFVSISIDNKKDHEKWKKMIVNKELGGMQLFADKNWESKFVVDYMIKGIPRFILIDPKGNIVTANAPRPSSKKLIDLFNQNNI